MQKAKEVLDALTATPTRTWALVLALIAAGGYFVIGPLVDIASLFYHYASEAVLFIITKIFLMDVAKECSVTESPGMICERVAGSTDWSRHRPADPVGYIWRRLMRQGPEALLALPLFAAAFFIGRYRKKGGVSSVFRPVTVFCSVLIEALGTALDSAKSAATQESAAVPAKATTVSAAPPASLWGTLAMLFTVFGAFMFLISAYFLFGAFREAKMELGSLLVDLVHIESTQNAEAEVLADVTEREKELSRQVSEAVEQEAPDDELNELLEELDAVRAEKRELKEALKEDREEEEPSEDVVTAFEDRAEELTDSVSTKLTLAKILIGIAVAAQLLGFVFRRLARGQ